MKLTVPDYISSITPYSPGKPLEELEREYGVRDSIKLASNENPLGPSPMAAAAIANALKDLNRYPDAGGYYLIRDISERLGIKPANVVLGNGSDEILGMLTQAFLSPGSEVIMPKPSFLMYDILVRSAGAKAIYVPLRSLSIDMVAMADRVTDSTRMVFLTNPNNPTGTIISKEDFQRFLGATPASTIVVIDEAYIEFVRDASCLNSMEFFSEDRALVILRTFSKAYGLAGLRIGYGIMPIQIAELLHRIRLPFNANSLAQVGALAALRDEDFLRQSVNLVHEGLDFMAGALDDLAMEHFPTQANFFLINTHRPADGVFERMLRQGVIVRSMSSYGYPEYIRVNVGLHKENVRFMETIEAAI